MLDIQIIGLFRVNISRVIKVLRVTRVLWICEIIKITWIFKNFSATSITWIISGKFGDITLTRVTKLLELTGLIVFL